MVIGAGGHAKVVIDLLQRLGKEPIAAATPEPGGFILGVPIVHEDVIFNWKPEDLELALGVGMPTKDPIGGLWKRTQIAQKFAEYGFPPLIHPHAVVANDCEIGAGAQIMAGAIVQPGCQIGAFSIVNTNASLDHDCSIGTGAQVAPGATLGGNVSVASESLVGIGATVLQGITIGQHSIVAAGAMVRENIGNKERWRGIPARLFS